MQLVHQLDPGQWRAFVDEHPQGNIFHTPEMYQVYRQARGHHPALWASLDEAGQILALFTPVRITLMDGFLRSFTSRAVVFGSALSRPGPDGEAALKDLLQAYNRATKSSLLFTELRNLSDLSSLRPVFTGQGFLYEDHLNFLIRLDRPLAEIWDSIRSNARRNIQKARKLNVEIVEAGPSDLPAAYAVMKDVYHRIQVPLPDASLFEAAFHILQPKGMLRLLLAKVEGVTVGALNLLLYKDVVYYWYTGTLREYSAYRTNDLLVWHSLELGSQNGYRIFDFGGGGKPQEEYGVRDFKAKFGGMLVNYGRLTCVHAPLRLKLSQEGYHLVRRFF